MLRLKLVINKVKGGNENKGMEIWNYKKNGNKEKIPMINKLKIQNGVTDHTREKLNISISTLATQENINM